MGVSQIHGTRLQHEPVFWDNDGVERMPQRFADGTFLECLAESIVIAIWIDLRQVKWLNDYVAIFH